MGDRLILLILSDSELGQRFEQEILRPAGFEVTLGRERQTAETLLRGRLPDLLILSDRLDDGDGLEYAAHLVQRFPNLPLIFLPSEYSEGLALSALRAGFNDFFEFPLHADQVLQTIETALKRRQRLEQWARLETRRNTKSLQERLNGLEALQRIGRQITGSLNLDSVLTEVVEAAVELTHAEEGSLLLLDETTGELYMRAGRNFQEDFVRTFRLPIRDTLAGQVLKTGQPALIDTPTPHKIKTAYLVSTLMYVPLIAQERVIGILGVDNRQSGHAFSNYHLALVSALADYAAIAIENANLYQHSELERSKLETILTRVDSGVIVVDQDRRLLLVNRAVRTAFGLGDMALAGKRVEDIFQNQELQEALAHEGSTASNRLEIALENGRVFNVLVSSIPMVGTAVTMQDITHLKELDRIKSDFVNTVSHDLRSPLTAILGYVELIERVGPVNGQQREFIHRVQLNVRSITALINDLLDLGRIEAGFDSLKELVPIPPILRLLVDSLKDRAVGKSQTIILDVPENVPSVLGNPVRLRQMFANLIGNAVKYTSPGGKIQVSVRLEGGLILVTISDDGPGIPPADQPYIFDKFYRASNTPPDTPGSGLGLAIVKSIVDNHQGRIWVESTLGQGTTFTIVLPATQAAASPD